MTSARFPALARGAGLGIWALSFGRPGFAQEARKFGRKYKDASRNFDRADFPFRDQFIYCRATDTDRLTC
jgi:hypothetical protein